ncbi:glycoside hydrolase/phage tail family protein [Neorhizobium sp. JUb45]|uniref:baseplate multidomain protein megatron n=1 Tax=unclassified Neorhizobium TaxID=2629175 RepID=UPI001043B4FC|nr:glycoside hydrolase/phage tail family protein [Neorhizobium sp. JUb45]TCR04296.1 putative tail protein [Neorhizobium sp. JUb45]
MATILFQAAGAALGGVFGPVGAIIGRAAGALAGSMVDRALINGSGKISGARLATARIPGADEGTAVNRVYGTVRVGGTLIWATRFQEDVTRERTGGKATRGPTVETFSYFGNLAVGICEGPIAGVRRVWADGKELDLTGIEMRVHLGSEDQLPDPLIEAKQGESRAPAYRGLAYAVFDHLPLDTFGNRLPLIQFEVVRPVGVLEGQIRAVTIIPGATEHGYATVQVKEVTGDGSARILNRNTLTAATDWQASIDELVSLCPNLERVALVVSWFGSDLRAGECRILPGVEVRARADESLPWSVADFSRGDAHLISENGGGPAYGGTPGDDDVRQAIADLKARGLQVYLYPFVMMDVPVGNGLADPHGGAEQAAYPWRGRISCHPAPGQAGSPDGSVVAHAQLEVFANRADGYRRMLLHYAHLCADAGSVDGLIIGSELRGLTQVRDEAGGFPFVRELVRLAGDVRAIVGPGTKLTYGADWSEYFGYHPQDGSGDVFFHLDPLWASDAIDAVGIDNYMPLSDWRDDDLGAANPDGARLADDVSALQAGINGGEGFDWYYASDADRAARQRSPISDGLAGKPWTFRAKDFSGWWSNLHFDRMGGRELVQPSAWRPGLKPIWFTELGCAAIDKGANQPNLFLDPKSSESRAPHFSSGARSDSMQRRFLEAHHGWWQAPERAGSGMVDPGHVFVWSWDARPFPAFPNDLSVWSDGGNWRSGHWLNGRLGATTLADAIAAILTDHGFDDFDVSEVSGDLTGYVQGELASARTLIEPLLLAFRVDVTEDGGRLRFRSRGRVSLVPADIDVLADLDDQPLWSETRGHDSDFAAEAILASFNPVLDYEQASARSRRAKAQSQRILRCDLPAVLAEETAQTAAEDLLRDNRLARRSVSFALSPAELALETGDAVRIAGGPDGVFLIERIEDGAVRRIEARRHMPAATVAVLPHEGGGRAVAGQPSASFAPVVHFLDLPRFEPGEARNFARVAAFCRPWRRIVVSSSATAEGFRARAPIERPARVGRLTAALGPGVSGRFDRAGVLECALFFDGVSSAETLSVLNDDNRLAVKSVLGGWEVIGFASAEEIAEGRWRLTELLRGLGGSEDAMLAGADTGAAVVVLDAAVVPLGLASEERGVEMNWLVEAGGSAGGRAGPFVFAGGLRSEMPLAPVHVVGARQADGAIAMSWVRRGRVDADSWEAAEIPLDEPDERYFLEIMSGEVVVRSVEVAVPAYRYGAAEQIADFGSLPGGFVLRLRQIGRAVPLGVAAIVNLDFEA